LKSLLLSVDLGTSSIKVAIYSMNLKLKKIVRRFYPIFHPSEEVFEQNPDGWWREFLEALKEIDIEYPLNNIEVIGLSGFNAIVGVDSYGQPTGPAITYLDRRQICYIDSSLSHLSNEYIFRKAHNRLSAGGMWAPILSWIRDEKQYYWRNTAVFLSSSGFIAAKLTGEFAVDSSRASLSLLHDPTTKVLSWDKELCELFNIDAVKLPPILNPWEKVGKVTPEAARLTGLPGGIPVIIGGMDSMCAALGSGITSSNILFDIGGSAGGLAAIDNVPHSDIRFLTVRYVIPGFWSTIGPLSAAGIAWQWFRETIGIGLTEKRLITLAKKIIPGSEGLVFIPYITGSRSPHWKIKARASFQGITKDHQIGHFARSVLEGLGFALKEIMQLLIELGYSFDEVRAAGGGSRNDLLLQIKADILCLPYLTLTINEASTFGAAILAAIGSGIVNDFSSILNRNVEVLSKKYPSQTNYEMGVSPLMDLPQHIVFHLFRTSNTLY